MRSFFGTKCFVYVWCKINEFNCDNNNYSTKTTTSKIINDNSIVQVAVQNADIAALWDGSTLNAGFIVVRPSPLSQQLYRMVREITTKKRRIDDQRALNKAARNMKKQGFRVNFLDRNQFFSGKNYFERSFPMLCNTSKTSNKSTCPLVVHNNWIVGKEAKIYRFREHLMWLYDGVDQYYSSDTRKYLAYENPNPTTSRYKFISKKVTESELSALKTALTIGHLLNRVVILPKFHCRSRYGYRQCPLNSFIHMTTFDFIFSGHYRESSFLQHPKVPDSVKLDRVDRPFILNANQTSDVLVSGTDIMSLFGKLEAKVLNLSYLQRVKIDADDGSVDGEFSGKLQSAFRRCRYRQLH